MIRHVLVILGVLFVLLGCAKQTDESGESAGDRVLGIRNGTPDSISSPTFPDVFALYKSGQFHCSSAAISPRLIVTAAHCVAKSRNTPATYSVEIESSQRGVARIAIHPDFNFSNAIGTADVAVVELSNFAVDGFADVAGFEGRDFRRLYSGGNFSRGSRLVGVGFGQNGTASSPAIRRSGGMIVSSYENAWTRDGSVISEGLIELAPDPNTDTIACFGDSGGPLVSGSHLVGFSSFVSLRDESGACGVVIAAHYASASRFADWVDEVRRERDPSNECRREGVFESADGGCRDPLGRVWSGQAMRARTWAEAISYCAASSESGNANWRLATPAELQSLATFQGSQYLRLDANVFWSSSGSGGQATAIDVTAGSSQQRSSNTALGVLCIRG